MYVTEPCAICSAINNCECGLAVTSFFSLLQTVNNRVLRAEPSSSNFYKKFISAGIDKLDAYFQKPVPVKYVNNLAIDSGLALKKVFLRDRKPYLSISSVNFTIYLKLSFDGTYLTGLISNPNNFTNWSNYIAFIFTVLPKDTLQSAQISRLDLNLDFSIPFPTMIQTIDIRNKRNGLTYEDQNGIRTGLTIGKGSEQIVIYDKSRRENEVAPRSRIELRLRKEKLPTRSILSIPEELKQKVFFNNLIGLEVEIEKEYLVADHQQKLTSFAKIMGRDGFYAAKKSMNQSGNFDRDFKKLIKIKNWETQPHKLFETEIRKFFK